MVLITKRLLSFQYLIYVNYEFGTLVLAFSKSSERDTFFWYSCNLKAFLLYAPFSRITWTCLSFHINHNVVNNNKLIWILKLDRSVSLNNLASLILELNMIIMFYRKLNIRFLHENCYLYPFINGQQIMWEQQVFIHLLHKRGCNIASRFADTYLQ